MQTHFDFAVVGAGMAGASLAARLAARAKVVVLEMEEQPGYHSTGRSAASWIEHYGNDTVVKLNRASFDFLQQPPDEYACENVLYKRGLVWTAQPGSEAALDATLTEHVCRIEADEALTHVPALAVDGVAGFAFEPGVYDIDVARLHQAHLRLLKQRGGELHCRFGVTKLEKTTSGWTLENAGGDRFSAGVVINAAGAWADSIAGLAGIEPLGLTPYRRSAAIVTVPEPWDASTWSFVADVDEAFYFRPDAGNIMFSPADETPVEAHDVWADDLAIAEGAEVFAKVMQFEVQRVTHTWAGLRTFSNDRTPVVGMDDVDNFFWFAGQGGYGIQTSPAMASVGASLLLGEALEQSIVDQALDLDRLAPQRLTAAH